MPTPSTVCPPSTTALTDSLAVRNDSTRAHAERLNHALDSLRHAHSADSLAARIAADSLAVAKNPRLRNADSLRRDTTTRAQADTLRLRK